MSASVVIYDENVIIDFAADCSDFVRFILVLFAFSACCVYFARHTFIRQNLNYEMTHS